MSRKKVNFIHIIKRIKSYKGIKTDQNVATLLGLERSAFAQRKKKDSIPYFEIINFCIEENLSIDYLLTGEENGCRICINDNEKELCKKFLDTFRESIFVKKNQSQNYSRGKK